MISDRLGIIILSSVLLHSSLSRICSAAISPCSSAELYYLPKFEEEPPNIIGLTADYQDHLSILPPAVENFDVHSASFTPRIHDYWFNDHELDRFLESIRPNSPSLTHQQGGHQLLNRDHSSTNSPGLTHEEVGHDQLATRDYSNPNPPSSSDTEVGHRIQHRDSFPSDSPTTHHAALGNIAATSHEDAEATPSDPIQNRKRKLDRLVSDLYKSNPVQNVVKAKLLVQDEVKTKRLIRNELNTMRSRPSKWKLKLFGWVSTLKYAPGGQKDNESRFKYDLEGSEVWRKLGGEHGTAPALLNWLIGSGEVSKQQAVQRLKRLLKEISTRHGELLSVFLPMTYGRPSLKHKAHLIGTQEQTNLLNWFLGELEMKNQYSSNIRLEAPELHHDLSRHLSRIIRYLRIDPDVTRNSSSRWEIRFPVTRNISPQQVKKHQAETTRAALKSLETYYKLTNPDKWKQVFLKEDKFLNLFISLKNAQHHCNFGKSLKKSKEWATLAIFPWHVPLGLERSTGTKSALDSIHTTLKHVNVASINKHFVDLERVNNPFIQPTEKMRNE
ncbi:hypothetical protein PGT21_031643 [Puccinia graminis f. sp. tritici]|uniref:Uncharacterized protein n=1 Tax=Puccinia graminis f. sp. tritici TaxID=56615 RepID=A0A5B0R289_PUCGR|nr:hypothetical protein PGT21_031643 [Puccinia graminis f. sp. tritici]